MSGGLYVCESMGRDMGENAENRKTKQSNNTKCDKSDSNNNNESDTQRLVISLG